MALMRGLRSFSVLGTNYAYSYISSQVIPARTVSLMQPLSKNKEITITFIKANGERIKAKGEIGNSILDIVVNNDLDLDGYGACEGTLTCSTCHLVFSKDAFKNLSDQPTEEEIDMLDLAQERGPTSRLGCQVIVTEEQDGIEVRVPAIINDARQT
ncbi:PREDICTED: adrenodoxin [Cyphomyrmex costatus]|uniref:Adrenodoxin, mitochondrial n=1 Tax=Cyphomyrmex costatus TaxID=456900 RepID=A0A195CCK4_9HYME|nr:PREDICTED: adrenodoxin [Cyphomyrmex costatus]KYM97956.1 Adrenodoxin, mitochondrial [Cyphomyrmex costatus]